MLLLSNLGHSGAVTVSRTPGPWTQPWAPPVPSSASCSSVGRWVSTLSLPRGGSTCYTCSFAKPCYPVPTECGDDEACGVSIGTSEQNEVIQRKGCLPRAQCPLPGHATYWSRSYALRHHCCDQDLCNGAPRPLVPTLLLTASFTCGGHLLL
ncbi:lymphocyte antigen 6G6e-like isoform X2 [Myotis lucifugus]|uniref:lymphocyte antigen 6G6e-like isoform X2 n=1 Tax=Myotis lucifugus TaxID=59463 RepID=UPI0006D7478B|nr:lymphocyte antigen 6G6e-like isoform X2 [Myotis lucifugus]